VTQTLPHHVEEFSVLTTRGRTSDFFDQPVADTLPVPGVWEFLEQCRQIANYTYIAPLEDVIRKGFYQYLGNGRILAVDNVAMEAAYLESLINTRIISQDQASKVASGFYEGAADLFVTLTVSETATFNDSFNALFEQAVTASVKDIDVLDGARLIYGDGSMIVVDREQKNIILHWKVDGQKQKLAHHLSADQSMQGIISAVELYMKEGQVAPQYATLLVMRFNLNLSLVPVDEAHLVLERDLGL
jgi:hypothetical protein